MSAIEPHSQPHNDKLRYIFDNARVGIAICNAVDNRLEVVNPAFAHIHGYEPHELIGASPGEVFAPECMLRLSEHESTPSACAMGDVSFETTHIRKDGSTVPVSVHITVIKNHKGEVVQRIANIIDISARKEAETKLQTSNERFNQIFHNSPDVVYLIEVTPEGRFIHLDINPAFIEASGMAREVFVGRYVDEIEHEPFRNILLEKYNSCLKAGKKTDYINDYPLPSGIQTFHSILTPIFDESGRLYQIIGIARDITEQKRQEEQLAIKEREFRSLAENTPDNIARWDTEGRYLYINPVHEQTLGKTATEVIGTFIPETHEAVKIAISQVAATGEQITVSQTIPLHDGSLGYHEVSLVPEQDESGKMVSVLGIGRDITERKKIEKQLLEQNRFLESLLNAIPVPIFLKDKETRYQGFNKAFEEFYGKNKEELIGKGVFDLFSREQAQVFFDADADLFRNGGTQIYEARLQDARGIDHTVMFHKALYFDEFGETMGQIGTVLDITERKFQEELLQRTKAKLSAVISTIPDLIWVKDVNGIYLMCNPALEHFFGISADQFIGKTDYDFFDKNAADVCKQSDLEAIAAGTVTLSYEPFVYPDSGAEGTWEIRKIPVSMPNGESMGILGIARDITERKAMEDKVSQNEIRLKEAQKIAKIGSWELDFSTVTLTWSDEIYRIFEVDNTTQPTYELFMNAVHPDDRDMVNAVYTDSLNNKSSYDIVHRLQMKDGRIKYIHERGETTYDENGNPLRTIGTAQDISERKSIEKKIEHMAHHDALTGLPNRTLAKARAEQIIAHAKRSNTKAAFLFIDLDGFKAINDTLGHSAGDSMLKTISFRLKECVRESDIISRQGGDEFLLILSDIKENQFIDSTAKKVLNELEKSFEINGNTLAVSGSIGIALYPDHGETFEALLQSADTAMYKAKELGKNSYHFYTQQMSHTMIGQFKIQNDLKHALINQQFVLFYQPQIDLMTNRIIGVEALIRWRHPQLGMIPPMSFIPVAESSGLIVQIGQWVIEEACRQAALWNQIGIDITVAVNISAMQFKRGNLEEVVKNALLTSKINPKRLELELTESIMMHNTETTLECVRNLKALGIQLSLDDFGTGYSSLSYLKRFAVDKLKIDQSFVRDILQDREDAAIVKTIIQMAKNLNLKTIAEGVEDANVLAVIDAYGCDEVQGYHFAKPMEAHELELYHANFSARNS